MSVDASPLLHKMHSLIASTYYNHSSYGADPSPQDNGMDLIIALMDKLLESSTVTQDGKCRSYSYQLVSCLKLLIRAAPVVNLPYKVSDCNYPSVSCHFHNHLD